MTTDLSTPTQEICYCPNCESILNEQTGFDPSEKSWTCTKCGQLLYGDISDSENKCEVVWFCDNCKAILNNQEGFSDQLDEWVCNVCGHHEDFSIIIEPRHSSATLKERVVNGLIKSKPTIIKASKWIVGVGIAVGTVLAAAAITQSKKDNETEEDEFECDDNLYSPPKKSYQGYVPSGCKSCGGPYPLCKGGCPAFDDE